MRDLPTNCAFQSALIALAKAKPGQLNYLSSSAGTSNHLAAELFKQVAGVNMLHVPYRTSPEALSALLSKNVDVLFDTVTALLGQVESGKGHFCLGRQRVHHPIDRHQNQHDHRHEGVGSSL